MPFLRDQIGREIDIPSIPKRIISTVPSQTELLYSLGLHQEVCGITAYCIHPEHWRKEKTIIGGTKDLNLQKIRELQPDLVICNKEENVKEQVESIASDFPVWVSDVTNLNDAFSMIGSIGLICGRQKQSAELLKDLKFARKKIQQFPSIRFLYLIWNDPIMVAGKNTFISSLLEEFGLKNAAPDVNERYPQIFMDNLKQCDPQFIILSSEPYAFSTADAHRFACHLPKTLVKVMDGQLFSWYGSRIVLTFKYLPRVLSELNLGFLKK